MIAHSTGEMILWRVSRARIKFYNCTYKRAWDRICKKSNTFSSCPAKRWQGFYLILHPLWFYPSACCCLLFPWALSWQSFGWGAHACQVSRPQASPAFGPGCTDLLSAAPACSNPHPHRQSHGWGLQAPRGVPAEPGGLGGWGAVLSWPGGLSPTESPDAVSRGACCCCRAASHQLLPFLSLPTPARRVHKVLRALQVTDESSGARGSMDASAWEKCSEGGRNTESRRWRRGEGRGSETDSTVLSFRCWQVTQKETVFSFSLIDSNQSRLLTHCRVILLVWVEVKKG